MPTVSPTQWTQQELITAASLNQPINQIAAVINGGLDDANINSFSGTKINAGTLPATASTTDSNVVTRMSETMSNFIVPGGLVLSVVSGLNVALSAGTVYINGARIPVNAVASTTLPASQDVYVSVSSTGAVSFASTVNNNTSSPSLPANSIWIGQIVTNGTSVTLINQGATALTSSVLPPLVSNVRTWKFDTNGNRIYPNLSRQPLKVYDARVTNSSTGSPGGTPASYNGFPGTYNFAVVAGRTYDITLSEPSIGPSGTSGIANFTMNVLIGGTLIGTFQKDVTQASLSFGFLATIPFTATTTGNAALTLQLTTAGASYLYSMTSTTSSPAFLEVKEQS